MKSSLYSIFFSIALLAGVLALPSVTHAVEGSCSFESYVPADSDLPVVTNQPYVLRLITTGIVKDIDVPGGGILFDRNARGLFLMRPVSSPTNRQVNITVTFEDGAVPGKTFTRTCRGTSPNIVSPATLPAPAIYYLDRGDERSTTNRTADLTAGNPAPVDCAYPPHGSSETTCANRGFQTMYGAFTATAAGKAAASYFTARSSADRRDINWSEVGQWNTQVYTSQTPLTVPAGTEVVLQWSCQEYQNNYFEDESGLFGLGNETVSRGLRLFSGAQGDNFVTGGARRGSVTVTPTQSTTYTVTCTTASGVHPGPLLAIPVSVAGDAGVGAPTATFSVNGTPVTNGGTYTATPGTPVTITATFATAANDVLRGSALNGPNTANEHKSVPCASVTPLSTNCWLQPDSIKTYTFTPTEGSYTFWANSLTAFFGWDHRASVTIAAACPSGGSGANCTVCQAGYGWNGGACVQCGANEHVENNTCVANTRFCPVAHGSGTQTWTGSGWGTCSNIVCDNGYTWSGTACVNNQIPLPTINSFNATRVRNGNPSTLSWNITGLAAGASCSISPTPASGQPNFSNGNGTTQSAPVTRATVYTLSCTNGTNTVSKSATAQLLPEFQEI